MTHIRLVCVGRLREKFYIEAAQEYLRRLSAWCRIEVEEVAEARLPERPSQAETDAALEREAALIASRLPKGAAVIALCIEGTQMDSAAFARTLEGLFSRGVSKLCFVVGGSHGLHPSVKERADIRLSMSPMTFPHHLARVMLLEQLYRSFQIRGGGKYHK